MKTTRKHPLTPNPSVLIHHNQSAFTFHSPIVLPTIHIGMKMSFGHEILITNLTWINSPGHDYQVILENGFSASLQCVNGNPQLIEI